MTVPHYGKREPGLLTAASPGDTLYFNFGSYNDSGDSEAMTGFAVTDIEVFKNGIATTRATDSGYSLISDTGQLGDRVGLHRFSIQLFNTSDDTGHYQSGAWYQVAVDQVTIDGKTVRAWVGSFEIGRQKVNVVEIDGDTGPADNLGRIAGDTGTGSYIYRESDTGGIADAIWAKDVRTLTAFQFDTGVWGSNAARTLTAFAFDTGVTDSVWKASTSAYTADTGSVAYAQGRVMAVRNDTGAAHLDQGRFGVISDSGRMAAVLDTGKVAAAVWTSHATRTLTAFAFDTGVAQTVWRESGSTYTDTGSVGYMVDNPPAATVDTGIINRAVWVADASRTLTSFLFDTGVAATVWRSSTSSYTSDTGSVAYAQGRVLAIRNDTGAAHLDQGRFGVLSDSGVAAAVLDTGKVAAAVWTSHATRTLTAFQFDTGVWGSNFASGRTLTSFLFDTGIAATVWRSSPSAYTSDTGSAAYALGRLMAVKGDTGAAHLDAGRLGVSASATVDTGVINRAVWNADASRTLTAFAFDTGIVQTVWRASPSTYTSDTGSAGYALGRLMAVKGDTGAAHLDAGRLGVSATATVDTGVINRAVWNADASRTLTSYPFLDTGVAETVWRYSDTDARMVNVKAIQNDTGAAAHLQQAADASFVATSVSGAVGSVTGNVGGNVVGSVGSIVTFSLDTGIAATVWRSSTSAYTSDTGSVAYAQGRVMAVRGDTGAAHLDQGRFGVLSDSGVAAAVLDTGKVAGAVWTSHATRTLTAFAFDTGIWGSNAARTLTSFGFDTGVADTVWKVSTSSYTADTGSVGYAQGRLMAVNGDTGAAHLDAGRLGVSATVSLDTGQVNRAVWNADASRTLTAFALDTGVAHTVWNSATRTLTGYPFLDTGVAETVWRYTDTDARTVNVRAILNDTGAAAHLAQAFDAQNTNSDTGLIVNAAAIRAKTDSLTFTVAGQVDANIQYVNDVQVQGIGDTGTNNTWRPV